MALTQTPMNTYQLRAAHAASDKTHIKLKMSQPEDALFSPARIPGSAFGVSSSPFAADVSLPSLLCFGDFFRCFNSVGILAHWRIVRDADVTLKEELTTVRERSSGKCRLRVLNDKVVSITINRYVKSKTENGQT